MTDVWIYADETGNLDYNTQGKNTSRNPPYFGFGTACFYNHHGDALFSGLELREKLGINGKFNLEKGFHATDDNKFIRPQVLDLIHQQKPRFDYTFLLKSNAYPYVKEKGQMYLYKYAWYEHLNNLLPNIISEVNSDVTVHIIVATFGTKKREAEAREAIKSVITQLTYNSHHKIDLSIWDSASSWGLQVADYLTWAAQRNAIRPGGYSLYNQFVHPLVATARYPWGK